MASQHRSQLQSSKKASVIYHAQYDYPMSSAELEKWQMSSKYARVISSSAERSVSILYKNGYWTTNKADIKKRIKREAISNEKIKLASKRARIIGLIPTVEFVGITGSLAMKNSRTRDDIDLLIITAHNTLWVTRGLVYGLLMAFGVPFRRSGDSDQKDKLCLNMWLSSNNLIWPQNDRNLYTAHELAQIAPLVNKDNTYEQLLAQNEWILDFWPKSLKTENFILKTKNKSSVNSFSLLGVIIDPLLYWIQRAYMRGKITREIVTRNKALFHPIKRNE